MSSARRYHTQYPPLRDHADQWNNRSAQMPNNSAQPETSSARGTCGGASIPNLGQRCENRIQDHKRAGRDGTIRRLPSASVSKAAAYTLRRLYERKKVRGKSYVLDRHEGDLRSTCRVWEEVERSSKWNGCILTRSSRESDDVCGNPLCG